LCFFPNNTFAIFPKTIGLCAFSFLPEPCQGAFVRGTIHEHKGQFLPADANLFVQFCLLPFCLIYGFVPLSLGSILLYELIVRPEGYWRFFQTVLQQELREILFTLVLFGILALLLVYVSGFAWEAGQSFVRAMQTWRSQKRGQHHFGLLITEQVMGGRLVDNIGRHNCLWLPKSAVQNVSWQQIREVGARRSRWVYRTRLLYINAEDNRHWLTPKSTMFHTGHPSWRMESDRTLFEMLETRWHAES